MITEAELHHWGDVYVEAGLIKRGIQFETFLEAPHEILDALERQRAAIAALPSNVTYLTMARRRRALCGRCSAVMEDTRGQ